ncbi:MAG TPA: hypothetical protein VGN90_10520 [Pyrinomonadaceae bacterium]|nr:hypothetical protein [Pyrinomonadaceae bacterium]
MRNRTLALIWINALVLTMSLSVSKAISARQAKTRDTRGGAIFVFHTDEFWLNLHHFLYVLGRAENKERDAAREAVAGAPGDQASSFEKLSAKEQQLWRDAVAAYAAGMSKKDVVFDDPLPALTHALAEAGDAKSLTGSKVDPGVATILERAAPVYRKAWWKKHHEANQNWQKAIQALLDLQGATVLAFITNAYQLPWPAAGFPVHVSAYSNWAGAYSTTGDLLVLSSLNPSTQGDYGLETIFHEGMHQWDGEVFEVLREQAKKVNKLAPRELSHALIFFTAGEAVRRVGPEHVPYAEKFGVWQRGMSPFKAALEEIWKPYLDGHGTRNEAFAKLIIRTAIGPPQKSASSLPGVR